MKFTIEDLLSFETYFIDFDGTLVDSESLHFKAHKKALSEQGFDLSMKYYIQHGMSRDPRLFYEDALNCKISDDLHNKIQSTKRKILIELVQFDLKSMPCAVNLLKLLKKENKKILITSASENEYVQKSAEKIGVSDVVDGYVCCDSKGVKQSKPAPDIFNMALNLSSSQPNEVLAIEDSVGGANAAENAGIKCLVFPNEFTSFQKFPDSAIISSCSELMLEK